VLVTVLDCSCQQVNSHEARDGIGIAASVRSGDVAVTEAVEGT